MQEMRVQSLDQKDPLEKDIATHSNILAGKISWTEELGQLQYIHRMAKSQTPLSNWAHTHTHTHTHTTNWFHLFIHESSNPLLFLCYYFFCPNQSIWLVFQSKTRPRIFFSLNHVKPHHSLPVTLLSTYFCGLVLSLSISAVTLLDLALTMSGLCCEPASYLVSLPLVLGPLERILLI